MAAANSASSSAVTSSYLKVVRGYAAEEEEEASDMAIAASRFGSSLSPNSYALVRNGGVRERLLLPKLDFDPRDPRGFLRALILLPSLPVTTLPPPPLRLAELLVDTVLRALSRGASSFSSLLINHTGGNDNWVEYLSY